MSACQERGISVFSTRYQDFQLGTIPLSSFVHHTFGRLGFLSPSHYRTQRWKAPPTLPHPTRKAPPTHPHPTWKAPPTPLHVYLLGYHNFLIPSLRQIFTRRGRCNAKSCIRPDNYRVEWTVLVMMPRFFLMYDLDWVSIFYFTLYNNPRKKGPLDTSNIYTFNIKLRKLQVKLFLGHKTKNVL